MLKHEETKQIGGSYNKNNKNNIYNNLAKLK